jgi:hypothetical protein
MEKDKLPCSYKRIAVVLFLQRNKLHKTPGDILKKKRASRGAQPMTSVHSY